jgi:hypothetical protein
MVMRCWKKRPFKGRAWICFISMTWPSSAVVLRTSGASATTSTASLMLPTWSAMSRSVVCAIWTTIPPRRYFLNPDCSTTAW